MLDINKLVDIATQAGKLIMGYYNSDYDVSIKSDSSPVTEADEAANQYIVGELAKHFPDIAIVSEEGAKPIQENGRFFLVDPLDGTKGFISKNGQFTVNIGLIENKKAVLGVIYVPVTEDSYWGDVENGAFKNGEKIECSDKSEPVRVVASKAHRDAETNQFIEDLGSHELVGASSSLKFCLVAEGSADLYPRYGRTMEWDTAAGQAILEAAGGSVKTIDGEPFVYAKNDIFENSSFIASS